MFRSRKDHFLGLVRNLERTYVPHLAVFCVLMVALISTGCGNSVQASNSQSSQSLRLSALFPNGIANESYNAVISVSGGNAPYRFAVLNGTIPQGLTLNTSTGSVSGTPTTAGTYSFEISVTDSQAQAQGSQKFKINVNPHHHLTVTISVAVAPGNATVKSSQKQQFTASVSGTSDTAVTWSASPGSIDSNGLYTAPSVSAQTNAVVTATSAADSARQGSAALTIAPAGTTLPPAITTTSLPQGQQGTAYGATFAATGGTQPYTWSLVSGTLPAGVSLSSAGQLSGVPSAAGTSSFTVSATDANALSAQGNLAIVVTSSGGGTSGNFDGPAELPRVTVSSSMASTPAPGNTATVNAGGDLQAALNNASCGDTILLQAGAVFHGKYVFPAKPCDDGHWIIVRTNAPDTVLPAEGQRMTPCYGGVASLPGRPAYPCSSPQNVLAQILLDVTGDGAVRFAPGANHYRILGLELARPAGMTGAGRLIIAQGVADHIVLDRSWLHGAPQDETANGMLLNGISYAAVVDSYFNDFKCISMTGTCTDAHAVSGGTSTTQDGPYLIQNNFLEASGEGVMFGGGAATTTPADIQVLHNHFFKPWQWMKGQPNFVGGASGYPFIVKNHLELKNAVRVQVEANLMENSWGGFSQTGYGILLTPKNQHTPTGDVCPICQVTDVTIRYTHIIHAGGGVSMATAISGDGTNGSAALAGARWSLHDLVLDDLSRNYVGGGNAFEIMNAWPTNPLNTITISHVTAFPDPASHLSTMGNMTTNAAMYGLVFTNNVIATGKYPIWSTGGGTGNCAYHDVPITTIVACFSTYTFSNNALVGDPSAFPPSTWPAGNFFPAFTDMNFANYNNGNGGDYTLLSTSPYKGKATDGMDMGADIAGLNSALTGVQ